MMSLVAVFWMYVLFFGIVGGMRGWAKEILVIFAMILALFIDTLLKSYVPGFGPALEAQPPLSRFIVRAAFFMLLAFFGYESPALSSLVGAKARREKFQDIMLGGVLGAINGYLIFGTLWFYMADANYPLPSIVSPTDPRVGGFVGQGVQEYLKYLPPVMIGVPYIYFAVALAFVFVIIVFV
ncbi:MAG: CvpA family protein [Chloroflexi bacterium]|nr:CvpA family protein [Chloroflexota bacterium]